MCGRFTLRSPPDDVARAAGAMMDVGAFTPRNNIAPGQPVLVIRPGAAGPMRWGLVPSWAKDPAMGARLINARAETVAEKPVFRAAFRVRRCVVLADGFYEWQANPRGRGPKRPWFFHLKDDRPFAFAGLWERWTGPEGSVETCTILTTTANALVATVHDRMPVILTVDTVARWIATSADGIADLLAPCPAEAMAAYPVSDRVNRPANDDPSCAAPLGPATGTLL
ncbi:MAG: SOS response-associated peptidase [Alphaproteobacteria bacterium]|nr:SOS response-associated peptidase [Alphaproteobacteria bacterium]